MNYIIYTLDTETTGLDSRDNDIIELSFYRMFPKSQPQEIQSQRTWFLKPKNPNSIELGALKVNGHKLEDLKHETKHGRDTYLDPNQAIVEIENWIAEDNIPAENRVLLGHNVAFDRDMIQQLWNKCESKDSFPFGRRAMDTMMLEFFMDWCKDSFADSYSLSALTKKYNVKNEKAHSAEADTKATKDVFVKQVDIFKSILK